jgi:FKBP-type peptidyl-prolyl cis-trans isomerase FkpA
MQNSHVTPTGIAVALAVAVALGLLFFGPRAFTPFSPMDESQPVSLTSTSTQPSLMTALSPIPDQIPTELSGTDLVVGTGAEAAPGNTVSVHYVGRLPDGTVFDASEPRGEAFTFKLGAGQVIQGWDQGVAGMKVGGTRQLIIPPELGYGARGAGGVIPPNATLIFDVQLLDVR